MNARLAVWISAVTVLAMLALPGGVAAQHLKNSPYPYILIDLGTLGGPRAGVANFPPLRALTNSGLAAGVADTALPDPYAPNDSPAFNGDPYVQHAFSWNRGVLTDLGALGTQPVNNSSVPFWINERGDQAGQAGNGITDPLTGYQETEAVLWKNGQITNLGTLGGNESFASSVNDADQVVGGATNTIPDPLSDLGAGTQTRAFLWQGGHMQDLGTLGGPDAVGWLVNNRGQVAGFSYTSAITSPVTGLPPTDPFLWQHGQMQDLGNLGGTQSFVNGLNDRGEVAGQSNLAGDQFYHPFLWQGNTLHDLGTLGGNLGAALSLSAAGDVAGWATTPGDLTNHAVLWHRGAIMDLGTVSGDMYSEAYGVNIRGQVVGLSGPCAFFCGRGFLWQNGTIKCC